MISWTRLFGRRPSTAKTSADPQSGAEAAYSTSTRGAAVSAADEEHSPEPGLPPLRSAKQDTRLLRAIGVLTLVGVGAALILSMNTKAPGNAKKKVTTQDLVSNKLPPLVIPPAPPPPLPQPSPPPAPIAHEVPAIDPSRPILAAPSTLAKEPPDWFDRKMAGSLTISAQALASPPGLNSVQQPVDAGGQGGVTAGSGHSGGGRTELSARLEPSETKAASASLLPDRNFIIAKGSSLDCALETAIDTSLPGLLTCRLTRDVYSDNGKVLLLDRGTQLVGEHQGNVKLGQARVFALWTRAKTPNGVVINLNSPGADALGRSGLEGWVDNHFIDRFGAAILMSFIQGAVKNISNGGSTTVFGSDDRGSKIVEKILESTINIPPTIVKNQGDHIQVMVARDLDFSTVYGLETSP